MVPSSVEPGTDRPSRKLRDTGQAPEGPQPARPNPQNLHDLVGIHPAIVDIVALAMAAQACPCRGTQRRIGVCASAENVDPTSVEQAGRDDNDVGASGLCVGT